MPAKNPFSRPDRLAHNPPIRSAIRVKHSSSFLSRWCRTSVGRGCGPQTFETYEAAIRRQRDRLPGKAPHGTPTLQRGAQEFPHADFSLTWHVTHREFVTPP